MAVQVRPTKPALAHLADHEDDDKAGVVRGYIRGTDFSLPYASQWSRLRDNDVRAGLLRHMNCSYLSTHGRAPTLHALKQHAQSLCILIQALCPTIRSGEIGAGLQGQASGRAAASGGAGGGAKRAAATRAATSRRAAAAAAADKDATASGGADKQEEKDDRFRFAVGDAFDFLADLSEPYENDDPSHHRPLLVLANEVRGRNEANGTAAYHCPFAESVPRQPGDPVLPYANHHMLAMHANECLERLDHDLSATGGLLSLLPLSLPADADAGGQEGTDGDPARVPPPPQFERQDLEAARSSLLGQLLVHMQHLYGRAHELERAYANALDVLQGEAEVPRQVLSALGTADHSGSVVAYPQDRFVLANCGDDVWTYLQRRLDRREAALEAVAREHRRNGTLSDALWITAEDLPQGGPTTTSVREYARGLVFVNVTTRYVRLAGQGPHGTLFVMPAHKGHPGCDGTRELEREPAMVAVPEPKFPTRSSALEERHARELRVARQLQADGARARAEVHQLRRQLQTTTDELQRAAAATDALGTVVADGDTAGERAAAARAELETLRAERARWEGRLKAETDKCRTVQTLLNAELENSAQLAKELEEARKSGREQNYTNAARRAVVRPAVGP